MMTLEEELEAEITAKNARVAALAQEIKKLQCRTKDLESEKQRVEDETRLLSLDVLRQFRGDAQAFIDHRVKISVPGSDQEFLIELLDQAVTNLPHLHGAPLRRLLAIALTIDAQSHTEVGDLPAVDRALLCYSFSSLIKMCRQARER